MHRVHACTLTHSTSPRSTDAAACVHPGSGSGNCSGVVVVSSPAIKAAVLAAGLKGAGVVVEAVAAAVAAAAKREKKLLFSFDKETKQVKTGAEAVAAAVAGAAKKEDVEKA